MKTICFVVPNFPSVTETFVINQIEEVKKRGYKVIILTHFLKTINKTSQEHIIEKYDLINDVEVIDYNIPKNKTIRILVGIYFLIKYFSFWINSSKVSLRHRIINLPYLLRFYGKFRHVDVFHIQFVNSGQGVAEMKEIGLLKGKVITTFHGYDLHSETKERLHFLKQRYKVLFDQSFYLTVNTNYLFNILKSFGANSKKVRIIPMGIDTSFFKNEKQKTIDKNKRINFISVGRLVKLKGHEYAIKSVKKLFDAGYDVKYTIVGEGKIRGELEGLIRSLNLDNVVFLAGNKNHFEIRNLFAESHIFLMSSITDQFGRAEAQGVVTAEAQAMNIPVIAFNSGGVIDTLLDNKTGLIVPEKDIVAYTKAMEELINVPEKYKNLSIESRKFVLSNLSKKIMTEQFIKLYNS